MLVELFLGGLFVVQFVVILLAAFTLNMAWDRTTDILVTIAALISIVGAAFFIGVNIFPM